MSQLEVERGLIHAIVTAPRDPRPQAVLADWYAERGDPRGPWMLAALRANDQALTDRLFAEAQATLLEALGVERPPGPLPPRPGRVTIFGATGASLSASLACITQVSLRAAADTARPGWMPVESLELAAVPGRVALLERGNAAHGWPRLERLLGVTIDELWRVGRWAHARFAALGFVDTPAQVVPEAVLRFFGPSPVRLELKGAHNLVVARNEGEVWVSSAGSDPSANAEQVLEAVVRAFARPGDELLWGFGPVPPALARAVQQLGLRRAQRETMQFFGMP